MRQPGIRPTLLKTKIGVQFMVYYDEEISNVILYSPLKRATVLKMRPPAENYRPHKRRRILT